MIPVRFLYLIFFTMLLNCAYYTQQELNYLDHFLGVADNDYSEAKFKEAIPRARTRKFFNEGDTAAYAESLIELKKLELETAKMKKVFDEIKTKRDHVSNNCCR